MKKFLIIISIAFTPLLFWVLYTLLLPVATRTHSVEGLQFACIASATGVIMGLFLVAITGDEKNEF